MPMPIGKGNIFSWIAPSFTLHSTILERKNYVLHTNILHHFTASHPHTCISVHSPYSLTPSHISVYYKSLHSLTPSHIYVRKYNPHCFTHISISTFSTASQPHTCISVHSPITSQPHTLTHLSTFPTASHTHTLAHVSQYIPPSRHTLTHLGNWWLCMAVPHPSLFKFTLCQPANQPSRNSVTCSCRLQAHTLPTHTLHTLTPSHSRGSVEESLILQYMTINNSQLALKCKYWSFHQCGKGRLHAYSRKKKKMWDKRKKIADKSRWWNWWRFFSCS